MWWTQSQTLFWKTKIELISGVTDRNFTVYFFCISKSRTTNYSADHLFLPHITNFHSNFLVPQKKAGLCKSYLVSCFDEKVDISHEYTYWINAEHVWKRWSTEYISLLFEFKPFRPVNFKKLY